MCAIHCSNPEEPIYSFGEAWQGFEDVLYYAFVQSSSSSTENKVLFAIIFDFATIQTPSVIVWKIFTIEASGLACFKYSTPMQ